MSNHSQIDVNKILLLHWWLALYVFSFTQPTGYLASLIVSLGGGRQNQRQFHIVLPERREWCSGCGH